MFAGNDDKARKAFIFAVGVVVAAIVLAISTTIWIGRSDAFVAADEFLRKSGDLVELVGTVKEVSVSSSGESAINNYGDDGNAELSLDIVGARARAIGKVRLTKSLRVWQVTTADVRRTEDNQLVTLSNGSKR